MFYMLVNPAPIALSSSTDAHRYSLYTPELSLMTETEQTTAATPAIAYEYIWFGGQPVAQFDTATNTTHWTFTDHLGTPILQTNASGTVDWRVEYEPYGTIAAVRTGTTRHQPLRFAGQEYDEAAADRSYNIFRWYRAGWGRFTQADPAGLSAGTNVFAFGYNIPTGVLDPLGLYGINKRGVREVPMVNIRAACPGLGSACTVGYLATLDCHCDCTGTLTATLLVSGTLYYYPATPKALGSARPFDTSVKDAATAIAHEWDWHLNIGISRVDPIIRELEGKSPFGNKEECERTGGDYAVWVNYQFYSAVSFAGVRKKQI